MGMALLLVCLRRDTVLPILGQRGTGRWFLGLAVFQTTAIVLSAILSSAPNTVITGTVFRRFGLLTQLSVMTIGLIAASLVGRRTHVRSWLLKSMVLAGAIESCYAIAQYAGFDPLLSQDLYFAYGILRPPATMGNAMYLSGLLLIPCLISLSLLFEEQDKRMKGIYVLALVLHIPALILSGTRSALAGLVIGVLYLMARIWRTLTKRAISVFGGALVVLCLALLAFLMGNAGARFRDRVNQWVTDSRGGPRLLLWRDTIAMIPAAGLTGTGPDTFMRSFPRYESTELSRLYPDFVNEAPHNVFLDYLVTQGPIGLISFTGFLILAFVSSERGRREARFAMSGMQAALIGSTIWLFFANLTVANALYLQILLSLMIAADLPDAVVEPRRPAGLIGPALRVSGAAAAVFACFCVAWSDYHLNVARSHLAIGSLEAAQEDYHAAIRFAFPDTGMDEWYSELLAKYAVAATPALSAMAWNEAESASARAEVYSDQPATACYQSALISLVQGKPESGEQELRKAMAYAPNWYQPHLLLARLLIREGRKADGDEQGRVAIWLSGKLNSQVEAALKQPI
jgi:O-antigen ligase